MKIKSQRDFWSGLLFILVGMAFAWGSTSTHGVARPGLTHYPLGLAVLLALLGALLLFKALTIEADGGDAIGTWAWRPLLAVVGSVALFGWGVPRVGLLVALALLVFGSTLADRSFGWRDALLSSLLLTAASWALMIWGLKLPFPLWPAWQAA